MIITKILETTIDLFSPDDIYTVDVPTMLKNKLSERYINKCFSSTLILEVLEVVRYSDVIMVDNRLDGAAYINVQFKIKGIIYSEGEVLQGCKVVNVASSGIIVSHVHALGLMSPDPTKKAISVIKKDQVVPVIISDVRYNVGKSQATITCKPYTPQTFQEVLYNITDIISPEDTEKLDDLLTMLSTEEAAHAKLKGSKSYEFFKNLIYPYKTTKKFKLSPIGESFDSIALDLKSLLTIREGQCITNADPAVSDFLVHSKKHVSNVDGIIVIDSPLYPALSSIILQRIKYLTTLRGFAEQYDTAEKNQEHMAYWKVCMSLKE